VVSINDQHLSVQQALLLLRMSANGHPDLMASMVNQIILSEVVSQEDVAVTVEELQEAADRFRQSKGLLSAAAMRQWLEDMRLSQVAFEEMLEMTVKTRKVKERVTAERLDAYFESHRQEYDQVQLFEVKVATEELAAQLMNQAQEIGLLVATQKMLADSSLSGLEGTLTTRYADTLPSDLHSSPPGKIIGPYIENKQYVVAQVYSRQPAQLTGQTLDAVQEAVYQEWLAQKRAAATIRWHWM
jgi:putative peptide maturation system protein